MTYEQLIEWIYDHSEEEDYESIDTLKDAIAGADTRGTVRQWLDNQGYTAEGNSVYQRDIQTRIDQFDNLDEIRDQIASASSQDDLSDIAIGPIQRQYGKEPTDEIRDLLAEKGSELRSVEEEFRDSMEASIGLASTIAQLDSLEGRAADAPTGPLEQDLLRQIEDKRSSLEESES